MATTKSETISQDENKVSYVGSLGFDGTNYIKQAPKELATKITQVGTITYIGKAPIGTAQATAGWQAKKIDTTTGVVITWADGNANYDNVATDLTLLSYS
jgi:hypothetical protein